jgi:purine nucleosidase
MPKRQIIIDCDPGQDDAINLLLAMSSPDELDILGITAVAGNVPLPLTARNARLICDIAERGDVSVYAGCAQPMQRQLVTAEQVHGHSGVDGLDAIEPSAPPHKDHAVDFIIDTLLAAEAAPVTLVLTGPMTNIATAIERAPAILGKVTEIVLMAGAMREAGNYTPSAEFNVYVDPHAADIVFRCGRPLTVLGLDVSYQALATPERRARIRAIGNRASSATANMLDCFTRHDVAKYGIAGGPLHDPCTVAYLLEPDLFRGKQCNLTVETVSDLTMGHTAVDFWHVTNRPPNINWIHAVDATGFYALLCERLSRFD